MLHEIDHINNGIVYTQKIINELSKTKLQDFKQIITSIVDEERMVDLNNNFSIPKTIFQRHESNQIIFYHKDLVIELLKIPTQTLRRMLAFIVFEISSRA